MLDIKFIRENPEKIKQTLHAKKAQVDLVRLLDLDQHRRNLLVKIDELRAKQNAANDEISRMIKEKKDSKEKIAAMKEISKQVDVLEPQIKECEAKLETLLLGIPNVAHESVPVGGVEKNKVVRSWKEAKAFDFVVKDHIQLAEWLDIIDFKRGAKISGANFMLYKNEGARLERALFNFMLDVHTREHGYREVFPPYLVNTASMTGTGQLPKMKDDMYRVEGEDLYLIPTAEVPITNIFRDEILKEEDLPIYYTGYTACFRKEAGSYGKETRGLIRVHQFDKVELVKFVKPEDSYAELETLVANAEKILQLLELPYRVIELATGDLSFAAAKCYDLEVYAPGVKQWLEVSSCSNFEDFQARRCQIRYKGKNMKKPNYLHTLNGSGLALARTFVAILENYQTSAGDVVIPKVLRPFMGGKEKISRT